MTHASMETLVGVLDGELNELEERRINRHLATCPRCSGELAQLVESRTLLAWALGRVDDAEPRAWETALAAADSPHEAAAAAATASTGGAPAAPVRPQSRRRQTAFRWAAGLVLVAGAAAGAIVTPVIVERFFTADSPAVEPAAPETPAGGGVAVQPVNGAAVVALSGQIESARLQVVFEARPDVMMDYRGAAPAFVARDGEMSVRLEEAATVLRLRVPAEAVRVRVLVNGEVAAVVAEGEVVRLRTDLGLTFEVVGAER